MATLDDLAIVMAEVALMAVATWNGRTYRRFKHSGGQVTEQVNHAVWVEVCDVEVRKFMLRQVWTDGWVERQSPPGATGDS